MKKFCLIGVLLISMVGCSKASSTDKDIRNEKAFITLRFKGMKLVINNNTEDRITVFDSETEFSIKKNKKWVLADETHGLTAFTTNILSGEENELDLTNRLSQIKEKEIKVTIHYEYKNKKYETSTIYSRMKE
ncbi:hypothetical protein [Enterococcus wangshanyuanii]|uniref:Uncharacterized protein n=1 Tax=Enterococcus wangshanyuanii TaxID=2005703 RepID=A0ABQ1PAR4_9ENTE|nr:hypothetical protein [Enterococcus wangshanyuanii]GGC92532.1 hypothetical protein GCM10011573_22650 [Enterococcus wangshanyuanii]